MITHEATEFDTLSPALQPPATMLLRRAKGALVSIELAVRAVNAAPEATFGFSSADSPTAEDIEVTVVLRDRWRIADARLPRRDPFRLLAFVQRHGDMFDVVQWGADLHWSEFDSMAAAIDFVIASGPRMARERFRVGP